MIPISLNPMGRNTGRGRLPAGYIELEYLEANEKQWIDTGVLPWSDMLFYIDAEIPGGRDNFALNGTSYTNTGEPWYRVNPWNAHMAGAVQIMIRSSVATVYIAAQPSQFIERIKIDIDGTKAVLNGEVIPFDITSPAAQCGDSIYIFNRHNPYTPPSPAGYSQRIYEVKLDNRRGGKVHMIPALDPIGRPCMFDLVHRKPYYNQGTGEFLCGYKLPTGYTQVSAIYFNNATSTSMCYVDLGYILKDGCILRTRLSCPSITNRWQFSGYYEPGEGIQWGVSPIVSGQAPVAPYVAVRSDKLRGSVNDELPHVYVIDLKNLKIGIDSSSASLAGRVTPRPYNVYLGNRNGEGQYLLNASAVMTLYSFFYKDASVKSVLVPCKDSSNNACLYDICRGVAMYSSGNIPLQVGP